MKAIVLGLNGVEIADVEKPTINETQVLIEVYSSTINQIRPFRNTGAIFWSCVRNTKILGATCCGKIVKIGGGVSGFSIGDKVVAQGAGGWAEYNVADYRRVLPIPSNDMTFCAGRSI
ncbi:MAG: hypothetical protein CM15mP117_14460 [Alphaproteobacteria bacterium]|nr:MAG: hypothetical protein CM15mP117_14460 [Alphaproteobacteria bacterium]